MTRLFCWLCGCYPVDVNVRGALFRVHARGHWRVSEVVTCALYDAGECDPQAYALRHELVALALRWAANDDPRAKTLLWRLYFNALARSTRRPAGRSRR